MSHGKALLLLETPVHMENLANFLGRVVAFPKRPSEAYAPSPSDGRPDHFTSDILPDILPVPRRMNQKGTMMASDSGGVGTSLSSIFKLDFTRQGRQCRILECGDVKTYTLDNIQMTFQRLMRNQHYEEDVKALLKGISPHGAYFVGGFMTATNASWIIEDRLENTHMLDATLKPFGFADVPGLPASPGTLDVSGRAGRSMSSAHRSELQVHGEEIIAASYYKVKIKYGYDFQTQSLTRTPIMKRARRTRQSELSMAGEDEDVVEYDSDSDMRNESSDDDVSDLTKNDSDFPFVLKPFTADGSGMLDIEWL